MKAITKSYLIEIVNREIAANISQHRDAKKRDSIESLPPEVTDEEILDFILTIPFFDIRLKDFLVGNIEQETIIISQTWEIEYIKKVRDWSNSIEWLSGDEQFSKDWNKPYLKIGNALSLPY